MKHLAISVLTLLLFVSCFATAEGGCEYDSQCKGDRVCDKGSCVSPSSSSSVKKRSESRKNRVSTTCEYSRGPKAGETEYFEPGTPGLRPARVGSPCTDGILSFGVAVPDEE